jgi:hypothetical protein
MFAFLFLSICLRFFLCFLPLAPPIEPGTRWQNLRDILQREEFVVKYVQKTGNLVKSEKDMHFI